MGGGRRSEGVRKCSDIPVVEVSVLMFEGSWQTDCESGTAHKGIVKWDRVRALREGRGAGAERAQGVRSVPSCACCCDCAHIRIMPVPRGAPKSGLGVCIGTPRCHRTPDEGRRGGRTLHRRAIID